MELDPIAVGLKFGFLAVLYLFLLWVARSTLKDHRRGKEPAYSGPSADPEDATGMYSASAPLGRESGKPKLRVNSAAGLAAGELDHVAAFSDGHVETSVDLRRIPLPAEVAFAWCSVLVAIGYVLGRSEGVLRHAEVRHYVTRALLILLPLLVAIVAVYVVRRRRREPSSSGG